MRKKRKGFAGFFKLWFVRELTTLKQTVKMTGNTMRKMLFFMLKINKNCEKMKEEWEKAQRILGNTLV